MFLLSSARNQWKCFDSTRLYENKIYNFNIVHFTEFINARQ